MTSSYNTYAPLTLLLLFTYRSHKEISYNPTKSALIRYHPSILLYHSICKYHLSGPITVLLFLLTCQSLNPGTVTICDDM